MSVFREIIRGGLQAMNDLAGVDVVYRRQNGDAVPVTARPARPDVGTSGDDHVSLDFTGQDWRIMADALQLDGVPFLPQVGDIIDAALPDSLDARRWNVARADQASQCYRFTDVGRTELRIHTEQGEIVTQ